MSSLVRKIASIVLSLTAVGSLAACTATQSSVEITPSKSEVVGIEVVVAPRAASRIPAHSRIVITGIEGECATEVKDALMRRLVDNANYDVLARDYLSQILVEGDMAWAGRFNSETAVKLGELLGASTYIVGRVAYCGETASDSPDNETGAQYSISAVLQIVDLTTGKVLLSSASEGKYIPRPTQLLYPPIPAPGSGAQSAPMQGAAFPTQTPGLPAVGNAANVAPSPLRAIAQAVRAGANAVAQGSTDPESNQAPKQQKPTVKEPETYARIKAAEDLANSFADKFFSRPVWETVEMWANPRWLYSESIRYVKLGFCPQAVDFLEGTAASEIPRMGEKAMAEYLHNYGVALLCANRAELAVEKLRSAYRSGYSRATLKMLGLAWKTVEWSLDVQVDSGPELKDLLGRTSGDQSWYEQSLDFDEQAVSPESQPRR